MNSPEERKLRAFLAEIDRGMAEMQTQKAATMQKLADITCPYEVGDIAEAKGYNYNGHDCKIKSVSGIQKYGVYTWNVVALVLNKDGNTGHRVAHWTGEQDG